MALMNQKHLKSLRTRPTDRPPHRASLRTIFAKSTLLIAFGLATHADASAQDEAQSEEAQIATLLQVQVDCWNEGDIDGFMETYWKSPKLTFSSGGQTTRGWQATIDRYKRRYSTRELMGHLKFSELEVHLLGDEAAYVLGRWELQRESDHPKGNFSLVLQRIDGDWKIVHDHSSADEEE